MVLSVYFNAAFPHSPKITKFRLRKHCEVSCDLFPKLSGVTLKDWAQIACLKLKADRPLHAALAANAPWSQTNRQRAIMDLPGSPPIPYWSPYWICTQHSACQWSLTSICCHSMWFFGLMIPWALSTEQNNLLIFQFWVEYSKKWSSDKKS